MRQSFAWWSFTVGRDDLDPDQFLREAAAIGLRGVEMLPDELWPAAHAAGLRVVSLTGHAIERGFNDPRHHDELAELVRAAIDRAAQAAVPFVIVFSGNRDGRDDEDGITACVEGLAPLAAKAADRGVTLLLELLNSKVDHPDYHCDRSWWGFEVVYRVASRGLRVLYDAYHMQLMEGDLSRTLRAHVDLIGHIHTAGVPGRRELDDRQEVNWRAIAGLLRHLRYDRWVGHELVPRGDPLDALRQAHGQFAGG